MVVIVVAEAEAVAVVVVMLVVVVVVVVVVAAGVVVAVVQSIGKRGPISDQDRAEHLAHLGRPIFGEGGKIACKFGRGGEGQAFTPSFAQLGGVKLGVGRGLPHLPRLPHVLSFEP